MLDLSMLTPLVIISAAVYFFFRWVVSDMNGRS